ncbi:hypothetical protein RHGRI_007165 [Rhododendron griersonianum]|uniref:Uncharacterized protein n=1 Tax=Rhododendron griersonianum TaxID=479676 RepID=A0AAV6KXD2_9ERIC|nr:hypothetical protein RHGRI_007165 [Rhododendron griersonianum]
MVSSSGQSSSSNNYDLSFKILLIGDSGVGKSSLLVSFISNSLEDLAPTIGVDFKIKLLAVGGKRLKLTIWDTAGQEKFRTLTSSYYRGAQGIILVYDVMRRETFTNLSDVWAKELDLHSTNQDCVKMLVGNKVDLESERVVSREEGIELAKEHGCLFLECSAKTRENVGQCFEELALKSQVSKKQKAMRKLSTMQDSGFEKKHEKYEQSVGKHGGLGLGFWVRSNVTVGKGAEAEMVAMLEEHGRIVHAMKLGFMIPSVLDIDPERSMLAAADVVDAIALAAGGSGWLWVPS